MVSCFLREGLGKFLCLFHLCRCFNRLPLFPHIWVTVCPLCLQPNNHQAWLWIKDSEKKDVEKVFSHDPSSIQSREQMIWFVDGAVPEIESSMCSLIILFLVYLYDINPAKALGKGHCCPGWRVTLTTRARVRSLTSEVGFHHLFEGHIKLTLHTCADLFSQTISRAFSCHSIHPAATIHA